MGDSLRGAVAFSTVETLVYSNGYSPRAGLVEAPGGDFYGTTTYGGHADPDYSTCGSVFRVSRDGTLKTIFKVAVRERFSV